MARHDRRQQRGRRDAVQGIQREPERLQGRPGLQGHLSGDAERRHRRLPRQAAAAHHPGLRRRHRRDDGRRRRDQAGRRDAVDGRHGLRQEPVSARHRRLLFEAGRHHAVLPLQLVLADPLLQQGHLPEGRPRRRTTRPRPGRRSGTRRKKIKTSGAAPCGYHLDLADLDPYRELRRLEQPAVRHQRERPRRHRRRAEDQLADLRQALPGRSPTSPRTARSDMAAAPPRPSRSSSPANAASSPNRRAASATSSSRA